MPEKPIVNLEGRRNAALNTLYTKARFFVKELASQVGIDQGFLDRYDSEGYLIDADKEDSYDEEANRENFLASLKLPDLEKMAKLAEGRVQQGRDQVLGKDNAEAAERHQLLQQLYRRYSSDELVNELYRRYPKTKQVRMTPDGFVQSKAGGLVHISETLSVAVLKELLEAK